MLVTIVVPAREEIMAYTMKCLCDLMYMWDHFLGYDLQIEIFSGMTIIDQIRSIITTKWYKTADARDLLFMIDSDQTFLPHDVFKAIKIMVEEGSDVVCGNYKSQTNIELNILSNDYQKTRRIIQGPTGFMLISKPILERIHRFLIFEATQGIQKCTPIPPAEEVAEDFKNMLANVSCHTTAGDKTYSVIPFFRQRIMRLPGQQITKWFGEDYTFCWLVRTVGGVIKGFSSINIGHHVTAVKYLHRQISTWTCHARPHHFIPSLKQGQTV